MEAKLLQRTATRTCSAGARLMPTRVSHPANKRGALAVVCSSVVTKHQTKPKDKDNKEVTVSMSIDETNTVIEDNFLVPNTSHVYMVAIKKPFGIVIGERNGKFVVEDVERGGNGADAGISVGDQLIATTAHALEDNPKTPYGAGKVVLLHTAGESFQTVAAAIHSNRQGNEPVHLVFETPLFF